MSLSSALYILLSLACVRVICAVHSVVAGLCPCHLRCAFCCRWLVSLSSALCILLSLAWVPVICAVHSVVAGLGPRHLRYTFCCHWLVSLSSATGLHHLSSSVLLFTLGAILPSKLLYSAFTTVLTVPRL